MKKNSKNKKRIPMKQILLILVLFVFGILLITAGVLLKIKSNPKNILKQSLYELYERIDNNINYKQKIINFNKNFMIDSSFTIDSSYTKDNQYIKYFFDAINKTNNNIVYGQDISNKKLFLNIDSKKDNNNFIFKKVLIDNATKYIKTDNDTKSYINRGTSNYFELYNDSYKDNISYLLLFLTNSFIDNLNDRDIVVETKKTTIGNKEKTLNKISYYINNDILIKLLNKVHNDIPNDEKANKIVSSIDNEYKDKEISVDEQILRKDSSIEIIVYADYLYNTKKYELVYQDGLKETRISYTPLDDYSLITIISDNRIEKIYKITGNSDKYEIDILNAKNNIIGNMTIENSNDRFSVISNSETDDNKIMLNIDRILNNMNNNSYDSSIELHYSNTNKITKKKEVTIDIKGYTKVNNNVIINESIENNIIYDTLSEDEKAYINNYNKILIGKIHRMEVDDG